MKHTREALVRNRGLMVLIAALTVAYALEPSLEGASGMCRRLFEFLMSRGMR